MVSEFMGGMVQGKFECLKVLVFETHAEKNFGFLAILVVRLGRNRVAAGNLFGIPIWLVRRNIGLWAEVPSGFSDVPVEASCRFGSGAIASERSLN
jgi:hypothetical protein